MSWFDYNGKIINDSDAEEKEEIDLMDRVGTVYVYAEYGDDILIRARRKDDLTIGQAYNDIVKELGAPVAVDTVNEVVRLTYDGKQYRYILLA